MNIDKRRAEMVRLAAAVRERLNEPARLNDVSIVLSDDAVQQVLELTNHVTAIDSMLSNGESTFPTVWMNDGTLGHSTTSEKLAEKERELAAAREAIRYADYLLECVPTTIRRNVKRLNAEWRAVLTDARAARDKFAALTPTAPDVAAPPKTDELAPACSKCGEFGTHWDRECKWTAPTKHTDGGSRG